MYGVCKRSYYKHRYTDDEFKEVETSFGAPNVSGCTVEVGFKESHPGMQVGHSNVTGVCITCIRQDSAQCLSLFLHSFFNAFRSHEFFKMVRILYTYPRFRSAIQRSNDVSSCTNFAINFVLLNDTSN